MKQKKITKNIEKIKLQPNMEGKSGFPDPIKVKCFQCEKQFWIKFVVPQQDYSKKNNWDYWTGQETQDKICNQCLKELYRDKPVYWQTVKDIKKKRMLAAYISSNSI